VLALALPRSLFFFVPPSHPSAPCECSEMAFPRNMLNSLTPMALRKTTTRGAKGPPVALLPMRVATRRAAAGGGHGAEVEGGAVLEERPGGCCACACACE